MNKAFIFAAGFVLGGVIGTTLTVFAYQKEKKKLEEDKKILDSMGDGSKQAIGMTENPISTTPEELKEYYIQQLKDLGFEVYDTEVEVEDDNYYESSIVNPIEENEEEDETGDNYYPVEPNPVPYEIVEREFCTQEFYDSEKLIWYRGDNTMCTEDDLEMIVDWQKHIGDVEGRLNGCRGDELYFRNEVEQTDYAVKINKNSYKSEVEGESDE